MGGGNEEGRRRKRYTLLTLYSSVCFHHWPALVEMRLLSLFLFLHRFLLLFLLSLITVAKQGLKL
jgi:hypothetical protein